MKQLTQKLKDGKLKIVEVVPPSLLPGQILVKSHYSVISAGTEGSTVSTARKSLVGKAQERPQQVKQVIDVLTAQGPVQTYRAVMKKLEAHSPLGYSCAGEVLEVAPGVQGFSPGDLIACGGVGYANHAEIVAVPVNLSVKLPPEARLDLAAYNTIGAIALQGVRQADLRLGETCVVIGVGLLGQLTCLLLKAAGIRVAGLDVRQDVVEIARQNCADLALTMDSPGLVRSIEEFTDGHGADAVIITAATASLGPINLSGQLLRKRGKVVIVGNVPTGFDREPYYYRKELELKMSCSYGPGRYDTRYEELGEDYPVAYVRWTENRNMQAFQHLVHSGRLSMDYLTTHSFKLDSAPSAYDLILNNEEPYLGILVEYDHNKPLSREKVILNTPPQRDSRHANIAFIGAGSYAMSHLLPNIKGTGAVLNAILTSRGTSSLSVAERFGFQYCTSQEEDIWTDSKINTVFIATRHDSHADYTRKALQAGKNVFVEKPLCLTIEELDEISSDLEKLHEQGRNPALMVGFNRRFSPLTKTMMEHLGSGPLAMTYRINAGHMPADAWMQIPEIGGGRIIGEACHFIDYLTFVCGSLPVEVYATAMRDAAGLEDVVAISLHFENGSIGTVMYYSNGSKNLPKEYIEIYSGGTTAVINDFKKMTVFKAGKSFQKKLLTQDKGQKMMVKTYLHNLEAGSGSPIPYPEIQRVMLATFKSVESFRTHQMFKL
jgi:predicted dehydrogenase/threonine dehydrogenase-like Zn-dependent dehydrogenase